MMHVVSRDAGKSYAPVAADHVAYPVTSTEAAMMGNPLPMEPLRQVKKRSLCVPFVVEPEDLSETGSGQT
jgi:hypothetical protein